MRVKTVAMAAVVTVLLTSFKALKMVSRVENHKE
jgi:hypothetical protein